MTQPTRKSLMQAWPVEKVGTGPALTKRQIAERLGLTLGAVEAAIRRTDAGKARVPFPDPAGYAVPPDAKRKTMVPYWYLRNVEAYGRAAGNLIDEPAR